MVPPPPENHFLFDVASQATSLSGVALWPRIVFDAEGTVAYDCRGPRGEQMVSHWPTVLPPLAARPVPVAPGDAVAASFYADLGDGAVATPLRYALHCAVEAGGAASTALDAWRSAVDPGSNRVYYYDAATGATSWTWPPAGYEF